MVITSVLETGTEAHGSVSLKCFFPLSFFSLTFRSVSALYSGRSYGESNAAFKSRNKPYI
jgi:hypothetical protein